MRKPGWRPFKSGGLMETIGPLLSMRKDGRWHYGLATSEKHTNALGVVHGGALAALVDQAMSLVAWEAVNRQPIVTVHMDMTFFKPALPGDFLEVNANVEVRTAGLVFVEASVASGDKSVMKASCLMQLAKPRDRRNTITSDEGRDTNAQFTG